MRSYFKVYVKSTTSLYGTSIAMASIPPDGGWQLVSVGMPRKITLVNRFNYFSDVASVVMQHHDGSQLTRSGLDVMLQFYPWVPYNFHPKD